MADSTSGGGEISQTQSSPDPVVKELSELRSPMVDDKTVDESPVNPPGDVLSEVNDATDSTIKSSELKIEDLRSELIQQDEQIQKREDEDAAVRMELSENGPAAAVELKWKFLREKLAKSQNLEGEELESFLNEKPDEAFTEIFYKQFVKEKGYKDDSEVPKDVRRDLQAQAQIKSREYVDKSWSETTGDAFENGVKNIDLETFIMTLIGHKTGEGQYGHIKKHGKEGGVGSPEELILEAMHSNPRNAAEMLKTGFVFCQEKELRKLVGNPNEKDRLAQILQDFSPSQAKRFVFGMYNLLGQAAAGTGLSPDEAVKVVHAVSEKIKSGELEIESNEEDHPTRYSPR